MGVLISLIVVIILFIIGFLGAEIPLVFGTILPYLALFVFIIGIVIRIIRWAKSPVPFNITTTTGQQKSLDFIRQNKLDNPSSTLGVIGRMALEIFFFRSLFRNTKAELKEGPKLTYGSNKWLWLFGLLFHWSFLIIVLRHFRFFTNPVPGFVPFLQRIDEFFQVGIPIIYITNVLIIIGITFLFFRRIFDSKVRYISLPSDYFPLLLIAGIAISGIWMRYIDKVNLKAIKQLAVGIFSFNPVDTSVMSSIEPLFFGHLFLVCVLLIYFPMSKLIHMPGIFMTPTRNLPNNNRMKRHINPWNPEVEVHTYEEYEDEFRNVMKASGIPLEKEESDV